jgi:hypothetical protein
MDTLLNLLIALGYVVGPLSLAAMGFVGWRLVRDHRSQRRERP